MHRRTRTILVTAGVLALPLGLMTTAQAQEQADVTIRESDVKENRNLAAGEWQFLRDGIRQSAPGGADRSGVYWEPRTQQFPTSLSQDWTGSQAADGQSADNAIVIYVDIDGAGPIARDALLHEEIYGANDLWLTGVGGGSEALKSVAPSGGEPSGSGSSFAGPADEWATGVESLRAEYPDLEITQVGSNLSGDGQGRSEGLLRSVTLGDDTYRFTSDEEVAPEPEPTTRNVNGASDVERDGRSVDIRFRAQQQPENSVEGNRLRWRVAVVGESSTSFVQGFGDVDRWTRTFRRNTGTYTVRVFKNGEKVRELTVRTDG